MNSAYSAEVAFEPDFRLPLVYINLAIKAGAGADPVGQSGITNFAGEMLLRGTQSRTKEQIDLEIDQMGARLEVETRQEFMVVRGAVMASQLDSFLRLVSDLIEHPTFPEAEIAKLKSEIVSGILNELGSDAALGSRRFNEFLFAGHPYGNPIVGKIKDVQNLSREQIMRQYDELFREKNFVLIGTGAATEKTLRNWIDSLSENRPGGKSMAVTRAPEIASKPRLLIVDKPDRTQTQIFGGQIGGKMTDPEYFALNLGNYAFGGHSFSARMMTEIRAQRGWSYGAYSYFRFGTLPRSWTFNLYPANKDTPAALNYTLGMIEKLARDGVSLAEFEFAKKSLVNNAGFTFDTPQKRVENKLVERMLDLPDGFFRSMGPQTEKVTLDQVNSSLKKFLRPGTQTLVVVGTANGLKEPLAKAAGIPVEQVQVRPYTEDLE